MIDFANLLDAPCYSILGVEFTLATDAVSPQTLTGLDRPAETEEVSADGVIVRTLRRALIVQKSDLLAAGFDLDCLDDAAIVLAGTDYRVLTTAPADSLRELRLILIENP